MITEPMTLFTDYLLAGVTGWLGWSLFRSWKGEKARAFWTLAFASLAVGALLGGSYHGFLPSPILWKMTVLVIGITNFAMLTGSVMAMTTGRLRQWLLALAAIKFLFYSLWMLGHEPFIYVIVDAGASMAVITILHTRSAMRQRDTASMWILGGVVVSIFASIVQASGFTLNQNFNHNDLYHVIQIAATLLFFRGARQLCDRSDSL